MCSENVAIPSEVIRITLDGQGKTVIQAPGNTADAIFIRGKDITVKGFTLTGGRDGIHLSGAAAGASAIIDGNTIQHTEDTESMWIAGVSLASLTTRSRTPEHRNRHYGKLSCPDRLPFTIASRTRSECNSE